MGLLSAIKNPAKAILGDGKNYELSKQIFDPGRAAVDYAKGGKKKGGSNTEASDAMAQIAAEQNQLYQDVYRPAALKLVKDVNSTAIVDAAKASASVDNTAANVARGVRQKERLGVTGTPDQLAQAQYSTQLGRTVTNDGNINQARVDQQERNDTLKTELVNVGRGIAQQGVTGALTAAQAESNRNGVNANINAQNSAAKTQTTASAASLALYAAMLIW